MNRRRVVVFVAVVSLLSALAHALPVMAAPYKPPKTREEPEVFGRTVKRERIDPGVTARPFRAADPVRPARSTVDAVLTNASESERLRETGGGTWLVPAMRTGRRYPATVGRASGAGDGAAGAGRDTDYAGSKTTSAK